MNKKINELIASNKLVEADEFLEKNKDSLSRRDYLFFRGLIFQISRKTELARKYYIKVLKINKSDVPAIINLSAIYNGEGNHDRAKNILDLIPETENINYEIARFDTNFGLGNFKICYDLYDKFDDNQRNTPKLKERKAALILESGDPQEAVRLFNEILITRPESHQILSNIGIGYWKLEKFEEAEKYAKKALEQDPNNWRYKINLANIYISNDNIVAGKDLIKDVRDSGIKNYQTETTWARVLIFEFKYIEAIDICKKVLDSTINNSKALTCIADAYSALKESELATDYYKRSIILEPSNTLTKWHFCFHLLRNEIYELGWDYYKIGFQRPKEGRGNYLGEHSKEWTPNVTCEKLVIWGEQGIGDQLMFCLFLKYLPETIPRVEVLVDSRLVDLFSQRMITPKNVVFKSLECKVEGKHIPIGNLPTHYWNSFEKDISKKRLLNYQATKSTKIRVGIAWRGGINERMQRKRSVPLSIFRLIKNLDASNVQIVVLQYNPIDIEIDYLRKIFDTKITFAKYDAKIDVQAWVDHIASCNYIISVDNSAVHFAGAIGVPTLAMIPNHADFRWGNNLASNKWYESVTLLRNSNIKNINQLAFEIDEWLATSMKY